MNKMIIMIAFVSLFLLAGCGKPDLDDKNSEILSKILVMDGISVTDVKFSDREVWVHHETSEADGYDENLIADWAYIFGLTSEFDVTTINIVNEINGMEASSLTTSKENVDQFFNNEINESYFWENVEIKAAD